jgi:hypothetical protein
MGAAGSFLETIKQHGGWASFFESGVFPGATGSFSVDFDLQRTHYFSQPRTRRSNAQSTVGRRLE